MNRGQSSDHDESTTPHAFQRKIETLEGPIWSKIKSQGCPVQPVSTREPEQADSAANSSAAATTATTGEAEGKGEGEGVAGSSSSKRPFEEETSQ